MTDDQTFQRLQTEVDLIATHRDDSVRREAVRGCLREIDALQEGGLLEFERWAWLVVGLRFGRTGSREFALA